MTVITFEKIHEQATIPQRGSPLSAGLDLSIVLERKLPSVLLPGQRMVIKTGLKFMTESTDIYLRIAPRSGLSIKHGIDVLAGVIDADYRGEIMIGVMNNSNTVFTLKSGMKMAQLICEKIAIPEIIEGVVSDITERGVAGFGSTGI